MTRSTALIVRGPTARIATANRTCTSGHARLENKSDSPTMALVSPDEIVAMINLSARIGRSVTIHSGLPFSPRMPSQMDKVELSGCRQNRRHDYGVLLGMWRGMPWQRNSDPISAASDPGGRPSALKPEPTASLHEPLQSIQAGVDEIADELDRRFVVQDEGATFVYRRASMERAHYAGRWLWRSNRAYMPVASQQNASDVSFASLPSRSFLLTSALLPRYQSDRCVEIVPSAVILAMSPFGRKHTGGDRLKPCIDLRPGRGSLRPRATGSTFLHISDPVVDIFVASHG